MQMFWVIAMTIFSGKCGMCLLKVNDIDSRLPGELIKVAAKMDRRSYFFF